MYSPSSTSSDSDSSCDSYDRRRGSRRGSKSRRKHGSRYDDDDRYSKEARKISPLLQRYASQLSGSDDKPRSSSYRKKHKDRDDGVSRKELNRIKRHHEKEFKNLLQFLEKESSLLNGIEDEKREELHKIKREHEREVRKLFEFQEREVEMLAEEYERKKAELEGRLEVMEREAREGARRHEEQVSTLERNLELATKELKSTMQTSVTEMRTLRDDLATSEVRNRTLEDEVRLLKERLAEKEAQVRRLEGQRSHSSSVEEGLRQDIRRKEQTINRRSEVMRTVASRPMALSQSRWEGMHIRGNELEDEETSGLTSSSDFETQGLRKDSEIYRAKPPLISVGQRKTILRDHRDDLDGKRLTVSFSDEVEQRTLPLQRHDSLSRRLERMYLPRSR